jgi:hypothetical protein
MRFVSDNFSSRELRRPSDHRASGARIDRRTRDLERAPDLGSAVDQVANSCYGAQQGSFRDGCPAASVRQGELPDPDTIMAMGYSESDPVRPSPSF